MTTSRIVRGTKARIFLYICAVLIITGIIACYNNTLSQLEDAKKSSEICHQQEENLSTQLQVISDYKQRLEKSLKTEKAEHQQAKNDLENKLNEEKSKSEKAANEANLRFSSLQQHFNLLQTQYDDFKEECSKTQSKQMNEINDLQAKLKEVQEELKKIESSKENIKTEYLQLQVDKENLQKQLSENLSNRDESRSKINHLTKENYQLQKELEELKTKCSAYESIQSPNIVQELTSPRDSQNANKQVQPDTQQKKPEDKADNDNLADQQHVIQSPPNQNFIKSPTKSTTSSSMKVSQPSLNGARPLLLPTVTPKSANIVPSSPYVKKLPEGVVPVPEKRDVDKKTEEEKNELPEETINNRYRNKINDNSFKEEARKADEADKENGANEVFDHPVHMANYDTLGFGDVNDPIKNAEKQNFNKQHIDNLGIGDKEPNKAYENDYKDNQNEENDPEDDDLDEYADHLGRLKDPVVRH